MKRPGMIMWWAQWENGKIIRALYRPANAADAPAAPPPAESPKVERGVRAAPEPKQDRLL